MLHNKKLFVIFALLYTVFVMLALLLPFYMYIQESITNLKYQESIRVKKETLDIKLKIYAADNIKIIADSVYKYKIAFFDENDTVIYSNCNNFIFKNYKDKEGIDGDNIYEQINLEEHRNDAVKFVVIRTLDYAPIVAKVILLAIYMLLFLVLSSGALIYFSTRSLAQTNNYLEQFFNDAMHEIRTPLGIIQFNLDMLSQTVKKSNKALLYRTQAATKSLTSIYEDIEYFIKNKNVEFLKEDMNLSLFLRGRIEFFDVLAKIKGITLKSDIEEEIYYRFNRIEAQRIIDNNISNAIKYSKQNTLINISLKKSDKVISLIFKDQGIGIPDVSKIFKRYFRGDEIKGGFGIGLNIVDVICKKYNIKIEVKSEQEKGSEFIYTLNLS